MEHVFGEDRTGEVDGKQDGKQFSGRMEHVFEEGASEFDGEGQVIKWLVICVMQVVAVIDEYFTVDSISFCIASVDTVAE